MEVISAQRWPLVIPFISVPSCHGLPSASKSSKYLIPSVTWETRCFPVVHIRKVSLGAVTHPSSQSRCCFQEKNKTHEGKHVRPR